MERTVTRRGIERRYRHLGVSDVAAPDGWLHLVEDCLAEIDRHTPEEERGAVRVADIKEKHGSLRIYVHAGDWADDICDLFESMSEHTCAGCGAYVEREALLCDDCKAKRRR